MTATLTQTDIARLIEAYRSTTYRALTPGGVWADVRFGRASTGLDRAVLGAGARTWGIVTASNPAPRQLSRAINARRLAALSAAAESLGHRAWPAVGVGHSGWRSERSLLVLGIGREGALELGRRYGQLAVVWGSAGGPPELLVDERRAAELAARGGRPGGLVSPERGSLDSRHDDRAPP